MFRSRLLLLASLVFCLTSCQTLRNRFLEPAANWDARVGQLQYRGPKTTLIGEVLVRYSKQGDFELTFTKGPGVALMTIKQNDTFARARGPLARGTWSGLTKEAPTRLRGWFSLREDLIHSQKPALQKTVGAETFSFAF